MYFLLCFKFQYHKADAQLSLYLSTYHSVELSSFLYINIYRDMNLSISPPSHFSCMYICLFVSVLCVYVLYSRIQKDNILKQNNFYSLKQANVILYLTTVIVFPFHFIHNLHPVCVSVKL